MEQRKETFAERKAKRRAENLRRNDHVNMVRMQQREGRPVNEEDLRLAEEYLAEWERNRERGKIHRKVEDVEEPDPPPDPEPDPEPPPPPTPPPPPITLNPLTEVDTAPPVKRGPGRPRKHPRPEAAAPPPIDLPYAAAGASMTDRQKMKLIELIKEARDRKYETLRLYRPLPVQADFHMSDAHIRILRGGNRCLAPETELWDPVAMVYRRIDSIDSDFYVNALNETTGEVVVAKALAPFLKGVDDLYEITLSNGCSFRSTLSHQILTTQGWMSVADAANTSGRILLPSTSGYVQSTRDEDGLHSSRTLGGSPDHCRHDPHSCGGQPRSLSDVGQVPARRPIDAPEHTLHCWHKDDPDGEPRYIPSYRRSFLPSNPHGEPQTEVRSSSSDIHSSSKPSMSPSDYDQASELSIQWSLQRCTTESSPLQANRDASNLDIRSRNPSGSSKQQSDVNQPPQQSAFESDDPPYTDGSLRLEKMTWISSVDYIRRGPFYDFHVPVYNNYILASISSHNSGKTSATMCELAFALTGTHPQRDKYPLYGLRAIVVAKNMDKIGEVIWRCLGRPGAFKMTDDPETGEPRIERPGDREAGLTMRSAPPLIPRRLLNLNKDVTWESKKSMIPKKIIIPSNGNECAFYSGQADPFSIQGTKLDLVIFDEEIEHDGWFAEAIARLVDKGGRFVWGATPQTGTQKLYDLYLKSQEDEELGVENPLVKEFVLSIYDNPFISDQDRAMFLASLDDEDQIRVRIEGEHAISGFKIFNSYFFPRGVHGIEPFQIPDDWTRFVAIDPGVQVAAAVFAACPPKNMPRDSEDCLDESIYGDYIYVYDEIYIRRCDATRLANEIKGHIGSQVIHTMLLDHHGGNLTEIGSGKTPEQQYKDAFQKSRVPVPQVGRYFTYGSDDLSGGILRIKEFLRLREDGTPKLKILSGTCPQLVSAMSRYQWKVVSGIMTDKPLAKNCDPVDCLRYLCMHPGVRYQKVERKSRKRQNCYEEFNEWKRREKSRKRKEGTGHGITL